MAGNFDAKTDPLAPTHPIAPKFFLVVDKKILDTGCGRGRIRLASPDRPRLGCACRAPGSNPRTFMTKLKRSAYFWASPKCFNPTSRFLSSLLTGKKTGNFSD